MSNSTNSSTLDLYSKEYNDTLEDLSELAVLTSAVMALDALEKEDLSIVFFCDEVMEGNQ